MPSTRFIAAAAGSLFLGFGSFFGGLVTGRESSDGFFNGLSSDYRFASFILCSAGIGINAFFLWLAMHDDNGRNNRSRQGERSPMMDVRSSSGYSATQCI